MEQLTKIFLSGLVLILIVTTILELTLEYDEEQYVHGKERYEYGEKEVFGLNCHDNNCLSDNKESKREIDPSCALLKKLDR